jgi:hypothetical protein
MRRGSKSSDSTQSNTPSPLPSFSLAVRTIGAGRKT